MRQNRCILVPIPSSNLCRTSQLTINRYKYLMFVIFVSYGVHVALPVILSKWKFLFGCFKILYSAVPSSEMLNCILMVTLTFAFITPCPSMLGVSFSERKCGITFLITTSFYLAYVYIPTCISISVFQIPSHKESHRMRKYIVVWVKRTYAL